MPKKPKPWIAGVRAGMKKRGTVGAFTAQAGRRGLGVQQFAARVLSRPSRYSARTVKRAQLARTFGKMGAKRSGAKLPPVLKVAPATRKAKPRRRSKTRRRAA